MTQFCVEEAVYEGVWWRDKAAQTTSGPAAAVDPVEQALERARMFAQGVS